MEIIAKLKQLHNDLILIFFMKIMLLFFIIVMIVQFI